MALEILIKYFDVNTYNNWTPEFFLFLSANILSLLTDLPIIVMLWIYFNYFFQRKKQAYTKKYLVFSRKQKAIVIWALLILILNSAIFIASNLVDVLITFKVLGNK